MILWIWFAIIFEICNVIKNAIGVVIAIVNKIIMSCSGVMVVIWEIALAAPVRVLLVR